MTFFCNLHIISANNALCYIQLNTSRKLNSNIFFCINLSVVNKLVTSYGKLTATRIRNFFNLHFFCSISVEHWFYIANPSCLYRQYSLSAFQILFNQVHLVLQWIGTKCVLNKEKSFFSIN